MKYEMLRLRVQKCLESVKLVLESTSVQNACCTTTYICWKHFASSQQLNDVSSQHTVATRNKCERKHGLSDLFLETYFWEMLEPENVWTCPQDSLTKLPSHPIDEMLMPLCRLEWALLMSSSPFAAEVGNQTTLGSCATPGQTILTSPQKSCFQSSKIVCSPSLQHPKC